LKEKFIGSSILYIFFKMQSKGDQVLPIKLSVSVGVRSYLCVGLLALLTISKLVSPFTLTEYMMTCSCSLKGWQFPSSIHDMAVIRVNRNTKTVVRVLVGAGVFWLLVSIFFIKSSSDDNRPPQLRR